MTNPYTSSYYGERLNVVTQGQSKVVLKVTNYPKQVNTKQAGSSSSAMSTYDLVNQLQHTLTQISIIELLELSPLHKEILEKALRVASVPIDIDANEFQAMVNHISTPHYPKNLEEDDKARSHPHNHVLHIEVKSHRTWVRRVLIDNGAGLNIVSFNVVQQLDLSEFSIGPNVRLQSKLMMKLNAPPRVLLFFLVELVM